MYVHVFDDATLDILLGELDTFTDLVDDLDNKEKFVRSGYLGNAAGAEELFSNNSRNTDVKGHHGYFSPSGIW